MPRKVRLDNDGQVVIDMGAGNEFTIHEDKLPEIVNKYRGYDKGRAEFAEERKTFEADKEKHQKELAVTKQMLGFYEDFLGPHAKLILDVEDDAEARRLANRMLQSVSTSSTTDRTTASSHDDVQNDPMSDPYNLRGNDGERPASRGKQPDASQFLTREQMREELHNFETAKQVRAEITGVLDAKGIQSERRRRAVLRDVLEEASNQPGADVKALAEQIANDYGAGASPTEKEQKAEDQIARDQAQTGKELHELGDTGAVSGKTEEIPEIGSDEWKKEAAELL